MFNFIYLIWRIHKFLEVWETEKKVHKTMQDKHVWEYKHFYTKYRKPDSKTTCMGILIISNHAKFIKLISLSTIFYT